MTQFADLTYQEIILHFYAWIMVHIDIGIYKILIF